MVVINALNERALLGPLEEWHVHLLRELHMPELRHEWEAHKADPLVKDTGWEDFGDPDVPPSREVVAKYLATYPEHLKRVLEKHIK